MTLSITNNVGIPNRIISNWLGVNNVILHYISEQPINSECISDEYIESRTCIFGEKSDVLWKPVVKAIMMLCDYKKAKYHVTNNEYFIDEIHGIFKGVVGRYWFIEIASAIISRITNYYQSIYGYYDNEYPSQIKDDIFRIIHEFIYRNITDIIPYIDITLLNDKYGVGLSLCKL